MACTAVEPVRQWNVALSLRFSPPAPRAPLTSARREIMQAMPFGLPPSSTTSQPPFLPAKGLRTAARKSREIWRDAYALGLDHIEHREPSNDVRKRLF